MEKKVKILYAEDDELTRLNYTSFLNACGFQVRDVADGDAVEQWFWKEEWDLLLLDMDMPGKTGKEVLKGLRDIEDQTPVIILSSLECCSLLLEGADDFVDKGEPLERLKIRIDKILTRKRGVGLDVIYLNDVVSYNKISRIVCVGKKQTHLKAITGKIFLYLCLRKNEKVPEEKLCIHVWNVYNVGKSSELSSYISMIRKVCGKDNGVRIDKEYGGAYCLLVEE